MYLLKAKKVTCSKCVIISLIDFVRSLYGITFLLMTFSLYQLRTMRSTAYMINVEKEKYKNCCVTQGDQPGPRDGTKPAEYTHIRSFTYGQIRDVFQSMNQRRAEYQNKVERVMQYLKKFELSQNVQNRVRNWFQYNWEDRNTLGLLSHFLRYIR